LTHILYLAIIAVLGWQYGVWMHIYYGLFYVRMPKNSHSGSLRVSSGWLAEFGIFVRVAALSGTTCTAWWSITLGELSASKLILRWPSYFCIIACLIHKMFMRLRAISRRSGDFPLDGKFGKWFRNSTTYIVYHLTCFRWHALFLSNNCKFTLREVRNHWSK